MSSLAGIVCSVNMLPASSTRTTSEFASFAIERMSRRQIERHVVRLHVEQDLGVGDLAVLRDEAGALPVRTGS